MKDGIYTLHGDRAVIRVNASGELIDHAFFGEPHRGATRVDAEQDLRIPLAVVLREGQRHLVDRLDRWLSVGCKKGTAQNCGDEPQN